MVTAGHPAVNWDGFGIPKPLEFDDITARQLRMVAFRNSLLFLTL